MKEKLEFRIHLDGGFVKGSTYDYSFTPDKSQAEIHLDEIKEDPNKELCWSELGTDTHYWTWDSLVDDVYSQWSFKERVDAILKSDYTKVRTRKQNWHLLTEEEVKDHLNEDVWMWDYEVDESKKRTLHGYIREGASFPYRSWASGYEKASLTDPRLGDQE